MNEQGHVQRIIIGRATFQRIPRRFIEFIQNSRKIRSTLENLLWNIQQGDYLKYNQEEIFKYMSECQAQITNFWGNYRAQIISQIQNVQFANLRFIYLSQNKITNIQSLSSINFQRLQLLDLRQNKISQIKSLNRLSTPFLLYIQLYDNPMNEINALMRLKFYKNQQNLLSQQEDWQFYGYCLSLFDKQQSFPINYDLSVFAKLNHKQINVFEVISSKRIIQDKVKSMLKEGFPSIFFKSTL